MKNILRILQISKPLHVLFSIIAVLIVITAAVELIAPVLSKYIVDEIISKLQGKQANLSSLFFFIALSFAANLLSLILTTLSNRLGDHFGGKLRKFLTELFYNKVLSLPQSYFDSEISGKIVNQLSRGITSIQNFINTATNFILPMFLQSIFTILVLAYYNIPIAIFTFLLFPVYLSLSYYSSKKWGEEEIKKNQIEDYSRGRIQEVIGNIRLVKSFNNEKNEVRLIENNLEESNAIYAKQSSAFHTFDFLRGLSLNIILLLINLVVFYSAFRGILSVGEMVLILQLVIQARRPLFAMSFILTNIQLAEAGSKDFFEVLDLPAKEPFTTNVKLEKVQNPTITFSHVSFKYEASAEVLKSVSFAINAHEKVALVGHSGVGKSTVVNLILKFYEPNKGTIFLKKTPYAKLSHTYIRNNISLVFQENELFSSTVRENVAYGSPYVKEKTIIEALKLANAYDFVMALPKGLESEVGERGVRLSGGQKQRIQIARAILKNSPILILDEATSSLDAKSEKEVQDALKNLMKDKLVIVIAHRFSTIQNVDKIIVLEEGTISAYGTPQQLAKKKGLYKDLLRFQIEGNRKLLESFELY